MRRNLPPLADRGPLRVMFVITSMPVGGAETLLVSLLRRLDRERFAPELCCLKGLGPLGEELACEIPVHGRLLACKYDLRVVPRLTRLLVRRRVDAVVTVGAGDKMFWGRLAAWRAGVPVVVAALHSTGWPDRVGRLNRMLTPLTDAFIGVARRHGAHLVENEGFPARKVRVIPNGVDVERFRPRPDARAVLRRKLRIPADAPVVGVVAALRPEKNIELFLRAGARVRRELPRTHLVVVGDGPERNKLTTLADKLVLGSAACFLGTRSDVPELLSMLDVFMLTSRMEANPVSILEAMAVGLPVVAARVGSVGESVCDGVTGYLVESGRAEAFARRVIELVSDPDRAREMGRAARRRVEVHWSVDAMVRGYEDLIEEVYRRKCPAGGWKAAAPCYTMTGGPVCPPCRFGGADRRDETDTGRPDALGEGDQRF